MRTYFSLKIEIVYIISSTYLNILIIKQWKSSQYKILNFHIILKDQIFDGLGIVHISVELG